MPVKVVITNDFEHLSKVAANIAIDKTGKTGYPEKKAEQSILDNHLDHTAIMETHLFYSAEEFEEFE